MSARMIFHALGAHEFETNPFGAEVCDWLTPMLMAGNIIMKVGFHIFKVESSMHFLGLLNYNSKNKIVRSRNEKSQN